MPKNAAPKPVQGWFIPTGQAVPSKPKMPLLMRLVLTGAAILAVVLGSHASADGQANTPSQSPSATTSPTTTAPDDTP
ncbi:hypothetical protein ACFY3E_41855 [Streptomyces griseorubiginosus]|uniref:hypothetical protein n=1 Tax=Streptomyces griseorubiginosus TaxID=67304 RepID=UPI00367C7975